MEENEVVVEEAGVQSLPTFHVYKNAVKVSGPMYSTRIGFAGSPRPVPIAESTHQLPGIGS